MSAEDHVRRAAAVGAIAEERARQVNDEGWSVEHDDAHNDGELARAAGVYALASTWRYSVIERVGILLAALWPWHGEWFKPGVPVDQKRCLVKAGALIVAELERLERAGE